MSSISVSESTKTEWDELKPDNLTHDEFAQVVLSAYKQQDTELALEQLVDELSDRIEREISAETEFAARRGTLDALESTFDLE
jgi:hypothetical protein